MENNFSLKPGMRVIIRPDIEDDSNGISNASSYRGRVMTIRSVSGAGCKLYEDEYDWWWKNYQFSDAFYPDNCDDPHVDSSFDALFADF